MSSATTPKSDLFQTAKAVLIMSLFALVFILIVVAKDNITSFACNDARLAGICSILTAPSASAGSDQLIASRLTSACVDPHGLKISVAFDVPMKGVANVQVFTTGDDYFPSDQGLADSVRTNTVIPSETDH